MEFKFGISVFLLHSFSELFGRSHDKLCVSLDGNINFIFRYGIVFILAIQYIFFVKIKAI
jgi:hypothetical protein